MSAAFKQSFNASEKADRDGFSARHGDYEGSIQVHWLGKLPDCILASSTCSSRMPQRRITGSPGDAYSSRYYWGSLDGLGGPVTRKEKINDAFLELSGTVDHAMRLQTLQLLRRFFDFSGRKNVHVFDDYKCSE